MLLKSLGPLGEEHGCSCHKEGSSIKAFIYAFRGDGVGLTITTDARNMHLSRNFFISFQEGLTDHSHACLIFDLKPVFASLFFAKNLLKITGYSKGLLRIIPRDNGGKAITQFLGLGLPKEHILIAAELKRVHNGELSDPNAKP